MIKKINYFKKGTYSFERSLTDNIINSKEAIERQKYWKEFLGEGATPFTEYIYRDLGYTNDKILNLLTESDFNIKETKELLKWNQLICDLQNEEYSNVKLPTILWKNQDDQWDENPAFLTFFKPFLKSH